MELQDVLFAKIYSYKKTNAKIFVRYAQKIKLLKGNIMNKNVREALDIYVK